MLTPEQLKTYKAKPPHEAALETNLIDAQFEVQYAQEVLHHVLENLEHLEHKLNQLEQQKQIIKHKIHKATTTNHTPTPPTFEKIITPQPHTK